MSLSVNAQDNSVAAVAALAKSSTNASPPENLTPDIIRNRLRQAQQAAIAQGRRPDPLLIPAGEPMSMEELRAQAMRRYSKTGG